MAEPALKQDLPEPDQGELDKFGELVAEQLLEIRKAIPAPQEPIAPVVNVSATAPVVNVSPAELPAPTYAPVINVEAAAPQINVQPAGPVINLQTERMELGFSIEAVVAALGTMTEAISTGQADIKQMAAELKQQGAAFLELGSAMAQQAEALNRQADSNEGTVAALRTLTQAMLAPRSLVLDDNGQPIGVVVKRN